MNTGEIRKQNKILKARNFLLTKITADIEKIYEDRERLLEEKNH